MPYKPSSASIPEFREELKSGKKVAMGCAINTSSGLCAEMVSSLGYDFCLLDQQHSAIDPEKIRSLIQAVHAGGSRTMIRVGGHMDRIGIQQAFDLGSDMVLVPCVRTADDVKLAVSCAKYPVSGPGADGGTRSVYVNLRPQFPGGFPVLFDYVQKSGNESTFVAVQIETADALKNIEKICAVPGLDMVFIGPGDLATDMGLVKKYGMPDCWVCDEFVAAEKKIADVAAKHGKVAGYWHSDLANKTKLGFRFFVVDGDIHSMQAALSASLNEKTAALKELGF